MSGLMMHRLEVTNPFDGSPVGEVKLSSASEVDTAVDSKA